MSLSEKVLKCFCEDDNKKKVLAINEPELMKQFFEFINLNHEFVTNCSAYEVASVIRSYGFWYEKKDIEPVIFPVNPGDVFYVDLGAINLKYESGYMHSCLVLKRCGKMVMVIPGSSKKYGKNNFLIEDVNAGDGFIDNTGVMIDQARNVTITRIKGKRIGTVHPDTFKKIESKFYENYLPTHYKEFNDLKMENQKIMDESVKKSETIEELNNKVKKLEEYINQNLNNTQIVGKE